MASGAINLEEATLFINNGIVLPVFSDSNNDGDQTLRLVALISFPISIFLQTLFKEYRKGRNGSDDRLSVYTTLEDKIDGYGFNGESCILRFTCEIHSYKVHQNSIYGELLTSVFSPGKSPPKKLKPYRKAELLGQKGGSKACQIYHKECPISVFSYLETLSEEDKRGSEPNYSAQSPKPPFHFTPKPFYETAYPQSWYQNQGHITPLINPPKISYFPIESQNFYHPRPPSINYGFPSQHVRAPLPYLVPPPRWGVNEAKSRMEHNGRTSVMYNHI